jgi:hypothetical protein
MMGEASQEQHELLGFPLVLAAFDDPYALFVLTEGGFNPCPPIIGIRDRKRGEVRQGG